MDTSEECRQLKKDNKMLHMQLAAAQAEAKKAHLQIFSLREEVSHLKKHSPPDDSSMYFSIPCERDIHPRPPPERSLVDQPCQTEACRIDFSSRSKPTCDQDAQTDGVTESSRAVALERKMNELMSFMSRCDRGGWEQSSEGQGSLLRLFDIKQQLETLLSSLQPVSASELNSQSTETSRIYLTIQSAENLPKVDTFGHIDAYCVIDHHNFHHKTKVVRNNANPAFNETFILERANSQAPEVVRIDVKDRNRLGRNTVVGYAEFNTSLLSAQSELNDLRLQLNVSEHLPLTDKKNRLASLVVSIKLLQDGSARSAPGHAGEDPFRHRVHQSLKQLVDKLSRTISRLEVACVRIHVKDVEYLPSPGHADVNYVFACVSSKSATCKTCTVKRVEGRAIFNEAFDVSCLDVQEEVVLTVYHCSDTSRLQVGSHRVRVNELLAHESHRSVSLRLAGALAAPDAQCRLNVRVERLAGSDEDRASSLRLDPCLKSFAVRLSLDKFWLRHHSKSDLELGSAITDLLDLLASRTGCKREDITVLDLSPEHSYVLLQLMCKGSTREEAEQIVKFVSDSVANFDVGLARCFTKVSILGRTNELEAEKLYMKSLIGCEGDKRARISSMKDLRQTGLGSKILRRWQQQAMAKAFYQWDYEVEKSALLREQAAMLEEEKQQELSEKEQLISDISRELVETKESLDAQAQAAREQARQEQEQHRLAAQEHMERQHELERQLRVKISQLKLSGAGPRVAVTVKRAENLPKVDTLGWIDGYCVITLGDETHKTRIVKRQQHPEWNESFELSLPASSPVLILTLFDWELRRSDRAVGQLHVSLADIAQTVSVDQRYELRCLDDSPLLGEDGKPAVVELAISYDPGNSREIEELRNKISHEAEMVKTEMQLTSKQAGDDPRTVVKGGAEQTLSAPYWIKVHVKQLLHLPKTDTFGKCDPYCVLTCGKNKVETSVCMSTYDAVFDEDFDLYVDNPSQSLVVELFDSNKFSKDERVGRIRVPVGKLAAATQDLELNFTVEGKPEMLRGHDGETTSLHLRISPRRDLPLTEYADGAAAAPPGEPVGNGASESQAIEAAERAGQGERRLLKFTLKAARNLPKMDVFGKCDAFVKMCLGEQRRESRICKVNYDPTWNETFEFEVCDDSEDLVLTVWDWDRIGKDELVGSLHLPVGELKSYLKQDKSFPLQREHKPCIGHNGSVTTLTFTCDMFPIQESFPLLGSSEATESFSLLDSTISRRSGTLKVTLESAERLPKNDALMRSTDPYVILSVDGQTFQSRTRYKTLEPTWNETFEFSCTASESILSLAVFDEERFGKDRKLGTSEVRLPSFAQSSQRRLECHLNGAASSGKVFLLLEFREQQPVIEEDPSNAETANKRREALNILLHGVESLPKTDTFGKCDPFIEMELDGSVQKSRTVKNCYSAEFNQEFHFPDASSADRIRIVLYDANQLSRAEKIGETDVSLSQVRLKPSEIVLNLRDDDGKIVTGHDGKATTIRAHLTFLSEKDVNESDKDQEPHASDKFDLEIKALRFSSMPKMDVMGSCDAYLKIKVRGEEYRTSCITGYHGEWNDSLRWDAVRSSAEIYISAWDRDTGSKDDFIGEQTIHLSSISAQNQELKFELRDKRGKTVKGYDKKSTSIFLSFTWAASLDMKSLNPFLGDETKLPGNFEQTLKRLAMFQWHLHLVTLQAEHVDIRKPFLSISLHSPVEVVRKFKTKPAITKPPTWDEKLDFAIMGHAETLHLQITLRSRQMTQTSKKVGSCKIKVSDMLQGYLADPTGFQETSFVVYLLCPDTNRILKDARGHRSCLNLRVKLDVPETWRGKDADPDDDVGRVQLERIEKMIEDYTRSDSLHNEWLTEREETAMKICKDLDFFKRNHSEDQSMFHQIGRLEETFLEVRGELFTREQTQIVMGIAVTFLQLIVLRLLTIWL